MESRKINHVGIWGNLLDKILAPCRLDLRGLPWLLGCLMLLGMVGCPGPASPQPQKQAPSKVGRGDLPPLRIGMLECQELSEVLQTRWQEFSEQPIEIVTIDRTRISSDEIPAIDVLLYPANFIGSLTENEWIAPMPSPLLERLGGLRKTGKAIVDPSEQTAQGIDNWSSRWRSIARYNGKWMAMPLGAPCWVALARGLDVEPLKQLQQAIGRNQNSPKIAADTMEDFLSKAESKLEATLPERRERLAKILKEPQSIDKKALVHRFLWIMSTSESRYRGLIDPYKVTARLGLPEFARGARVLQRLALIEPTTMFSSPVDAWESVAEGRAVLGIGWPRTDGFQRATSVSDAPPLQLVPILFNGGDGMAISIGRKTRQSSLATEFMFWLNQEDNRIAMQAKTPRIEVLEMDNDLNRIREDYREYQTLQRLEAANSTLDMTPRFLNADQFVDSLADALLRILEQPEAAEARLEECKTQWASLIESTGAEFMRTSLERATGLSN